MSAANASLSPPIIPKALIAHASMLHGDTDDHLIVRHSHSRAKLTKTGLVSPEISVLSGPSYIYNKYRKFRELPICSQTPIFFSARIFTHDTHWQWHVNFIEGTYVGVCFLVRGACHHVTRFKLRIKFSFIFQNSALLCNKRSSLPLNDLVCVSIMAARSLLIALITLIFAPGYAQKLPTWRTAMLFRGCFWA